MDVFPSFFIFLFNKLNIFVDLKNIFCYTCVMKTSTLGKLLELPNFHHFYTVPIRENTESFGNYIITRGASSFQNSVSYELE